MTAVLKIHLNDKLYLKDPDDTELGRKIVQKSIEIIEKLGFEQFTFKKLALAINSTEASIYRYFENKHKLLIYIISWYWAWLLYRIEYETHNIQDEHEQLKRILRVISESSRPEMTLVYIDPSLLHRIVVAEAAKVYLTKNVDEDNKIGLFKEYKALCYKIASTILKIKPTYKYAHSLASTIIESAHQQLFFARHFKTITELNNGNNLYRNVAEFIEHLTFSALNDQKH
ncbi:TetR/AcrR family transcriptional regulator [Cytophagaceae bacterium ABcell3]|nr:TetR/AcrR family transcriptional regulator [Cytophagaceae bacterium ABcell3]